MNESVKLSHNVAAIVHNGCITIMQASTEFDDSTHPALSIWLNGTPAKKLRDFLNECYPEPSIDVKTATYGELMAALKYPPLDLAAANLIKDELHRRDKLSTPGTDVPHT